VTLGAVLSYQGMVVSFQRDGMIATRIARVRADPLRAVVITATFKLRRRWV
jgi:hypothetical protein